MTWLPARLARLEELWIQAGVPVENLFAPGITGTETRSILQGGGLAAPAEIIEWFAWHNGAVKPRVGITPLGPTAWTALSLREALASRTEWLRGAKGAAEEDQGLTLAEYWWPEFWLPIAEDGGQGVLAVDLREGTDTVAVRDVRWSNSEFRTVREDSLKDLIDVWIRIIERGGWTWSDSIGLWEGAYISLPLDLRRRSLM
jgi:hypothetical protein